MKVLTLGTAFALGVTAALGKIIYAGVNESGGEFGVFSANKTVGTGLPGRFGTDFAFINQSTVDIFALQENINIFRVAFLLERMCPVDQSTGKGLGATFNETYFSEFQDAINYITVTREKFALLDAHNYMRYNDPSNQPNSGSIIGNTTDPRAAATSDFAAFWGEMASRFKSNPRVLFGLMNEPHDMPTELILANDQAAINAIRQAGAQQLITAPGNGFTGGHSWTQNAEGQTPSSEVMNQLTDPLNNTAIEVHEYLDQDFSGTHSNCSQPGPENLAGLTTWLQQNNLKAIVGEFGGGNNQNCVNFISDMLQFLEANDVYIGWIAWAAGPLWGKNAACCGQDSGSLEPNTETDLSGPGAFETVWKTAVRPNIPTQLKTDGISSLTLEPGNLASSPSTSGGTSSSAGAGTSLSSGLGAIVHGIATTPPTSAGSTGPMAWLAPLAPLAIFYYML